MTKKNVYIKIDPITRKVYQDDNFAGVQRENLQNKLIFEFLGDFVEGIPRVLVEQDGNTYAIDEVSRVEDTYQMEIKSSLLKTNEVKVQLMLTEQGGDYILTQDTEINPNKTYFTRTGQEGSYVYNVVEHPVEEDLGSYYEIVNVPIFLSKETTLFVADSIDATGTIPEEYTSWIAVIEEKIAEMNNLNVTGERVEDGVEIIFTRKDGTQYTKKVNDGAGGEKGEDAKINGYNTITINGGTNIGFEQQGNVFTINNTYDDSTILQNLETLNGAVEEHDRDIQNIENDIEAINQDIDDLGTEIDSLELNKQDKLTAGTGINITNNVISSTGGGITIDIGNYQYTYEGYILPAIDVDVLRTIFANDKQGIPQTLLWTMYGYESQFKIVSSDEILYTYSIDILVHNKYHCAFSWDDETTGIVNPTVMSTDSDTEVDDITIEKNQAGELQLKDGGITNNKLNSLLKALNISDNPSDDKLTTEKTIYDYIASGNDGDARLLSQADLDYVYNTGFYFCNMCNHRPVNANGILIVSKISNATTYAVQMYLAFAEDKVFVRFRDNNAWKNWEKINNLSASDIYATNLQTVQQNLERIDERIDDLPTDIQINGTSILDSLKVANIEIKDNVVSTDTDKPLSANMGKELNDRIQNLASIGKYLAMWDCTTGLPTTNPIQMPYTYTTGDYYVISNIGTTNYMPYGATYNGTASTTEYVGTETLAVGDFFYYDGTLWTLMKNTGKTVSFANIAGQPTDNSNLANALNDKVGFNNYATSSRGGTIQVWDIYNYNVNTYGALYTSTKNYNEYQNLNTSAFIGKGTLENVFTGKNLETANNKSTTISSSSTDTEYPSAKAVYDYIQSLDGNNISY